MSVIAAWRQARAKVRAAVGALVVVGAAAVLTGAPATPTASAHSGPSTKAFDPDETGWAAVHGRTLAEFSRDLQGWTDSGHVVVDLEADTFGGALRLGGVSQVNPDRRTSLVKPTLTEAEFTHWYGWSAEHGLRLVDLEIFELDGARHYAAAWVQDVEGVSADDARDLTYAQFVDYSESQRRLGRMPVDVDAYPTAAGTRYALIWVDNRERLEWRLHGDLGAAEYGQTADRYRRDGLRQLAFDSVNGRHGGIWVGNPGGRHWLSYHDMSPRQYANLWHRNVDLGYRQIFTGRYQTPLGVRYAAIWRANSERPAWPLRTTIDTAIDGLIGSTPGLSVSVAHHGTAVYQRGFGFADVAGDVWMDSGHALRTASVAKAVAGVLTLRLEQQGVLKRTDTVAAPGLPPQHANSTYEQLVSNRGCVRHYANAATNPAGASADTAMAGRDFPSAGAAAPMFWGEPLVAGCTVGMNEVYSTHGYTIAAAGMEAAAGTPVAALLRQRLADPLGLSTLRQEEPDDPSVRRSKIYEGRTPMEVPRDQISWKTLGGGLETTPKDLTRLGSQLLAGEVMSKARVQHMWGGTGWGYSYGFSVGRESSHRRVAKNGSQRGADSFWLIYPDDGIVIAVMTNRRAPGGARAPAEAVANEIGKHMLAQLR